MNAKLGGALILLVVVGGVMRCSGVSPAVPPAAAPTTEARTTIHVSGTVERPGYVMTPRKAGAACTSEMTDDVKEDAGWFIIAGNEVVGAGRFGPGQVRDDVNPYGNGPGPCTFPFDDSIDMPAGGDVYLTVGDQKLSLNRLDLLVGPITIRTSLRGEAYLAQTCPDKAYSC